MANTSVQIDGAENVVQAYRHKKIIPWAVLYGKEILFQYVGTDLDEGAAELETVLEMMGNSKAVYKLRVYLDKDLKDGVIRSNTPDIGGINFRLNLEPIGGGMQLAGNSALYRELEDLRKQNKQILERLELAEGDGEAVAGVSWVDHVERVLQIPGVGEILSGVVSKIFASKQELPMQPGAAIAGPSLPVMQPVESDIDQTEIEKVVGAYLTIKSDFPDALDLLETLANVAVTKPGKIASMVGMVKTFL